MAGISLVSMLQAGDWFRVSTPATYYFSTYSTTTDLHMDSVQCAVLVVSSQPVGKCQTLIYMRSHRYVGL